MTTMTKKEAGKNGELAVRREEPLFYTLQHEMNRIFDEFGQGFFGQASNLMRSRKWLEPFVEYNAKVNVKDSDKELIVTAEIPGVDMKDIDVSLSPEGLIIKGEKREEKEEKDKGYYRMERSYGSFHRFVALPCGVDKDQVTAAYKDGVVKVILPKTKSPETGEKKIAVKAG